MQTIKPSRFILLFITAFLLKIAAAQDSFPVPASVRDLSSKDLTVSYSTEISSNKTSTGIGETYNGGIKTIFISGNKIRIRLTSLMRTQSIFLFPKNKANKAAAVTKESGKNKYRYFLTAKEWKQFNAKYDSVSCQFTYDSAVILNYPCRKAIITLKDGRSIGVFYTDSLKRKITNAEPLFACIPGLVLQYEYRYKKGKIVYTSTSVNESKIDPTVFSIPVKGVVTRKFSMKPVTGQETDLSAEEEDGDDKEEN